MTPYIPLIARICMSLLFLRAGIYNLVNFTDFKTTIIKIGLPLAGVFTFLTAAIQLGGGMMIAVGYHTKVGSGILIAFLVVITCAFQNFLLDSSKIGETLKNLGLIGGLLMLLYAGPGPFSIDG